MDTSGVLYKDIILNSLAEFPAAGILVSIPTQSESSPIETILSSSKVTLNENSFWKAPVTVRSVDIPIALPFNSMIYKIQLKVDQLGYSEKDLPNIKIKIGPDMSNLAEILKWNLQTFDSSNFTAGQIVEYCFEKPAFGKIVSIEFKLGPKKDDDDTSFLHIGRIFILGRPIVGHTTLSNEDRKTLKRLVATSTNPHQKNFKHTNWTQFRSQKRIQDIGLDLTLISGFCVTVKHGDDGYLSQVKMIRVQILYTDPKGAVLHQYSVGKFVIPKAQPATQMYFEFKKPIKGNIVSFEFLCNYGGQEICPSKINLF